MVSIQEDIKGERLWGSEGNQEIDYGVWIWRIKN